VAPERALMIVNPNANHGETRAVVARIPELVGGAFPFEVAVTRSSGHAVELAEHADGFDVVAAVGGDGTFHEVLNGLMRRPAETRPALGILSTGTGNDYATTVGVSKDLAEAIRQLASGVRRRFDVGTCNGAYFANSVAMGFDAKVTARAVEMKAATGRSGLYLYLSAMIDVMLHDFGSHHVRVSVDGGPERELGITLIAVCNGPTYGGGFKIVPMAAPNDGLLDMLVIDPLPLRGALWRFPFVVMGKHEWMRQTHFSQHTRIRVTSELPLPGQIDGEVMLETAYDIGVLPAAIDVIAPGSVTP
jgi:YegS/Rv2252/BmrU family lipid kinase